MEKKQSVSVILPIHEINDDTLSWFEKSIMSIEQQILLPNEVLIVTPKEHKEILEKYNYGEISEIVRIIVNEGKTDFCSQINLGVKESESEYFSYLEYDDEYSKIWFKNVKDYLNSYPEVDMFMPIVVETNTNGEFMGFSNEPVWAKDFSDEMGFIDNNVLVNFHNFNVSGMVMKKETFEAYNGLKSSIKLTFLYEFLLRLTYNDSKIMVIPKLGYKHTNQRPNSLFQTYNETMGHEEARFWFNQAKKEYYFNNEREITYEL